MSVEMTIPSEILVCQIVFNFIDYFGYHTNSACINRAVKWNHIDYSKIGFSLQWGILLTVSMLCIYECMYVCISNSSSSKTFYFYLFFKLNLLG